MIDHDYFSCAKCNRMVADETELIGGYITRLCTDHRNEWHEYVSTRPEAEELTKVRARLEVAIYAHDEQGAVQHSMENKQIRQRLYEIGRDWAKRNDDN